MVTLPLGVGAYERNYAGEPEVKLVNRFLEVAPTNLRERIALLSRPGTNQLDAFGSGPIRGNYSKPGLFGGDLFVVSGSAIYRYDQAGVKTTITSLINGTGHPNVTWMKGIGYEFLFIADGLLLQYYSGGTRATGVLTYTPGAITTQVVEIGGVYYGWNAAVDTGSPDGTVSAPWLAAPGTDPIQALANLINFDGVRGVDFSTALGGPNPDYSAVAAGGPPALTLTVTAASEYAAGNSISTTVSGSALAWAHTTLLGGGTHALHGVPMPDGLGSKALATVSGYVLVSVANSQKFFWLNPGEVTIDPLNFAEKESNPDNIVDMLTVGDQVLITGQGSTENWYATGDINAPFAPVEGRVYARGTIDGTTVVMHDSVVLVGDDGIVYQIGYQYGSTSQWGVHRISNHGIEERIRVQLRREQGYPP